MKKIVDDFVIYCVFIFIVSRRKFVIIRKTISSVHQRQKKTVFMSKVYKKKKQKKKRKESKRHMNLGFKFKSKH